METVIAAIQKTPIPTFLILGGLLFILLGFVNKLGGIIEVSTEHKRLAIPIGLLVLTIGLLFTIISPTNIPAQEPKEPIPPIPTRETKQPISPAPAQESKQPIPPTPTQEPKQQIQPKYMRVRALDEINVRNGPSAEYDVVRKVVNGDFVPVHRTESGWSYIGDGWVNSKFLYDPESEGE